MKTAAKFETVVLWQGEAMLDYCKETCRITYRYGSEEKFWVEVLSYDSLGKESWSAAFTEKELAIYRSAVADMSQRMSVSCAPYIPPAKGSL